MYKICKKTLTVEGTTKTVYGIISDSVSFTDISTDYEAVKRLVKHINDTDTCDEHIRDIIEDFIIAN